MNTVQIMLYGADGALLRAIEVAAETIYEMDVPEGTVRMRLNWPQVPTPSPEPSREDLPAFRAHVLRWLQEQKGIDAVSVEKVSGYGTDWEGDTAGGFYRDESIEVSYTDTAGKQQWRDIRGDDFMSLWRWVVEVWPEPADSAGKIEE